jgi:predicted DCC family thiol-disulfide oxidoreductase YuxK
MELQPLRGCAVCMEPSDAALVGRRTTFPVRYPLTLFYDASCPLCASEMQALKARDREGRLELVDCSAPDFDETVLAGTCIERAALMARMHARDAHGRWLVALDAIEAGYRAVGLVRAADLFGAARLRPLLDSVYRVIARHRQTLSRIGMHQLVRRLLA